MRERPVLSTASQCLYYPPPGATLIAEPIVHDHLAVWCCLGSTALRQVDIGGESPTWQVTWHPQAISVWRRIAGQECDRLPRQEDALSLHPQDVYQVPEETARVAHAIFPSGNLVMRFYEGLVRVAQA